MTTYNTGNPIGSTDPKDLYDNAENFDQATNGSGHWKDRLGVTRPTLAYLENEYPNAHDDAAAAEDARDRAEDYRDDAKIYRDEIINSSAWSNADIYETKADGISGTSNKDVFWVIPNATDDLDNLTLFKNNSGTADKIYTLYNLNAFMIEEGTTWS